jgi:hypothetical protein
MEEELRQTYKSHEIQSSPVSVDLPGSDHTWQVRIYITAPDRVTQDRLLDNPFYKNKLDALQAGLQWGREIIDGEIKKQAAS